MVKMTAGKPRIRRRRGGAKPKLAPSTASAVTALVKREVRAEIQTKYVANNLNYNYAIGQTAVVPSYLRKIIPDLGQGVGDFERIGDRIRPTKLRTFFSFYVDPAHDPNNSGEWYVNLIVLSSKQIKYYPDLGNLTAGTLLKVGDGNTQDPNVSSQDNLAFADHMPVVPELWTVHHRSRTLMRKNAGFMVNNNTVSTPMTYGHTCLLKTVTIKAPVLKYTNIDASPPTNFAPTWIAWITNSSGVTMNNDGPLVYCGVRSEMYYKDA